MKVKQDEDKRTMSGSDKGRVNNRSLVALGLTTVLWASIFPGIRATLIYYTPEHMTLLRFLVASVLLAVYAALKRMPLPKIKDLPGFMLASFLGITVYPLILAYGEVTVRSGSTSILVDTAPIFTALFATIFLRERLKIWGWAGIMISFAGVALIALGEGKGSYFAPGALLLLLGPLSFSLYSILQKYYLKSYDAITFTAYTLWIGTFFMLVFLPGLFQQVQTAPLSSTLIIVYLSIFPTVIAYIMWAYLLSRNPVSTTTSFLYLLPPLTFVIAWIWLGELPTAISLIGGIITLMGIALVTIQSK